MKEKVLLAFTTFNQLDMTRKCLEYAMELGFDILVIDDCSTDGTQQYLSDIKVEAILKSERKGLTDSWNRAYKYFKASDYSHMVLSNNDVLIPKGAVEGMISEYPLVVPMCNESGAGYACKEQAIKSIVFNPEDSSNVEIVQGWIGSMNRCGVDGQTFHDLWFKSIKCWTGFCMCMSRDIIYWEFVDGNLFDPRNINVGNDDDLAKRVNAYASTYIALGAFVYHFKGASFGGHIADRDNLNKNY